MQLLITLRYIVLSINCHSIVARKATVWYCGKHFACWILYLRKQNRGRNIFFHTYPDWENPKIKLHIFPYCEGTKTTKKHLIINPKGYWSNNILAWSDIAYCLFKCALQINLTWLMSQNENEWLVVRIKLAAVCSLTHTDCRLSSECRPGGGWWAENSEQTARTRLPTKPDWNPCLH